MSSSSSPSSVITAAAAAAEAAAAVLVVVVVIIIVVVVVREGLRFGKSKPARTAGFEWMKCGLGGIVSLLLGCFYVLATRKVHPRGGSAETSSYAATLR